MADFGLILFKVKFQIEGLLPAFHDRSLTFYLEGVFVGLGKFSNPAIHEKVSMEFAGDPPLGFDQFL